MPITKRRFDLVLVGWICAIIVVLPLLEIWVATGFVPRFVRGLIELYARGGDPLIAAMPFYARYVFIVHAFAFTPLHVAMIIGLVRSKPWFSTVAVAYLAAGLTIDGLYYWCEYAGPFAPSWPYMLSFVAPYTVLKLLLGYRATFTPLFPPEKIFAVDVETARAAPTLS